MWATPLTFAVAIVATVTAAELPLLFGVEESAGRTFNAKTGAKGLINPFQHTFIQNKNWTSPTSWKTYKIPDQFDFVSVDQTEVKTVDVFSTNLEGAISTYFSWHVFYGIIPLPVVSAGWIDAHELGSIKGNIELGAKLYGWSMYIDRVFSLNVKPAFALPKTADFTALLSALPTTATSAADKSKYRQFIDQVGTHYVCRGTYGGRVSQIVYMDASAAGAFSGAAAFKEMGMFFHLAFFHLTASQFKNKNDINLSAKFMEMTHHQTFFTGGELTLQQESPLTQLAWRGSVQDKAALIEPTLCSIADLIDNEQQKATMEAEINAYLQG